MSPPRLTPIWLCVALVFAVMPWIDLKISALFYDPGHGRFLLEQSQALQVLREVLWNFFHLIALVVLIYGVQALYSAQSLYIPGRFWGYCLTLIVVGPVILVNLGLKSHWGRARPAEVEAFGGTQVFTPALQFADQCSNNCSFVSGEASAAMVSAIILGLLLWNVVPQKRRPVLILGLAVFVVLAGGLRVMKGRHFVSDVVWAWVFMATLAVWLARIFDLRSALRCVTHDALRADLRSLGRDISAGVAKVLRGVRPALRNLLRMLRVLGAHWVHVARRPFAAPPKDPAHKELQRGGNRDET